MDNKSEKKLDKNEEGGYLASFTKKPQVDLADAEQFRKCQQDRYRVPPLTTKDKLCYGVGHVFNDLCASMWFSYLLIFFEKVRNSIRLVGTVSNVVTLL